MRNEELVDLSIPRFIESAPFTTPAAASPETVQATAVGAFTAVDVWLRCPAAWGDDVEFRIYGRVGDARVLLKFLTLGDSMRTVAGSEVSAFLVSVRGWAVNGFEVTVRDPRGPSAAQGRILLQVWQHHTQPAIIGGPVGPLPLQSPLAGVVTVQQHAAGPPFLTRSVRDAPRYVVSSGSIVSSLPVANAVRPTVTATGTHYLLTLRAGAKRVEIQRVSVPYWGNSSSDGRLVLCYSGVAPTPGNGVAVAARRFDVADPSSVSQSLLSYGTTLTMTSVTDLVAQPIRCSVDRELVFDADAWGKPIVLRAGTNDSFGVRLNIDNAQTGGAFAVLPNIIFTEI